MSQTCQTSRQPVLCDLETTMPTTGIELTTAAEVAPTLIDDAESVDTRLIELAGHISGLRRELEQTKEALDRSRADRYYYQLFSQGCCCFRWPAARHPGSYGGQGRSSCSVFRRPAASS